MMRKEQARTIITVACELLEHSRRVAPAVSKGLFNLGGDCFVLLDDATKLFCEAVSVNWIERSADRWTSVLPKLLYEHPEKCDEILALVENNDFPGISALQTHAV